MRLTLILITIFWTAPAHSSLDECPVDHVLKVLFKSPTETRTIEQSYDALIDEVKKFAYFEKERVVPATETVLKKYKEKKIFPLPLTRERDARVAINANRDRMNKIWPKNFLDSNAIVPRYEVQKKMQIYSDNYGVEFGGDSTLVFMAELNNKKIVFRPLTEKNAKACRTTLAGSILNSKLGLHTVSKSELAYINNELVVISEYAQGERLKSIQEFYQIKSKSKYDSQAYEFLIGNADVRTENFYVKDKTEFMVFDQGGGFHDEIMNYHTDESMFIYGNTLPDHYSKSFVQSLQQLNEKEIRATLQPYLTKYEIDGVIFRRDIILEDIKNRPQSVSY